MKCHLNIKDWKYIGEGMESIALGYIINDKTNP